MGLLLPKETSKPKAKLEDFTIFIYGQPKIGKSTFCSQMDHPLFLATEAGLNSLEAYQVPVDNWETFVQAAAEIAKGDHKFKTIVIDTVDNLLKFCSDYMCKKAGVIHESDLEWGKGWSLVNNEFLRVLTKLSLLPYGLVMVGHSEITEIKTRTGSTNKVVPTLNKGGRKSVLGMADIILYAEIAAKQKGEDTEEIRVLRTKPSENYEAGDRTGILPPVVKLSFADFKKAFDEGMAKKQNGGVINA